MNPGENVEKWHGIVSTGPCPNGTCNHTVFVTRGVYNKLIESGASFYCPSGHSQSFDAKEKRDEIAEAKRLKREAEQEAAAERQRAEVAERTCPWPTCDGRILSSPRGLRQHMVKAHGAPWATAEITADEVGQVLNGRDPAEVVK